jgi:hypothetical protein
LYRVRWTAKLDLRSLKRKIQKDLLWGKTPDLVRKELWAHVLANTLVRTAMVQAAARRGVEPRRGLSTRAGWRTGFGVPSGGGAAIV